MDRKLRKKGTGKHTENAAGGTGMHGADPISDDIIRSCARSKSHDEHLADLARRRVLIVDDSDTYSRSLDQVLKTLTTISVERCTHADFIHVVDHKKYDTIIITDFGDAQRSRDKMQQLLSRGIKAKAIFLSHSSEVPMPGETLLRQPLLLRDLMNEIVWDSRRDVAEQIKQVLVAWSKAEGKQKDSSRYINSARAQLSSMLDYIARDDPMSAISAYKGAYSDFWDAGYDRDDEVGGYSLSQLDKTVRALRKLAAGMPVRRNFLDNV